MGKPSGVYAVTVGPDISEEPVRWLFESEHDADLFVKHVEPEGVVTFEPIAYSWAEPEVREYAEALQGDLEAIDRELEKT